MILQRQIDLDNITTVESTREGNAVVYADFYAPRKDIILIMINDFFAKNASNSPQVVCQPSKFPSHWEARVKRQVGVNQNDNVTGNLGKNDGKQV